MSGLICTPLDPRIPPVTVLLSLSSPAAVPRFVVPVVVDPVDRRAIRARSHVGEEVLELEPAFADRDPPAAIVGVRGVPRIEAAAHHPLPRMMSAGIAEVLGCAVRELPVHLLPRLLRKHLLRFLGVMLAREWVRDPGTVPGAVPADAVTPLIDGCVFAATAGTKLRLKGCSVLFVPFRLGDSPLGLFGVMAAFNCHGDSLYQLRSGVH